MGPKLVLFGESLGSYGTETTFGDLESMAAGAHGTLLVGPPFANPIWRELVDERDDRNPGVARTAVTERPAGSP